MPYASPDNDDDDDDDEYIMIDMNFNCSCNEILSSLGVILEEMLTFRNCKIPGCNGLRISHFFFL